MAQKQTIIEAETVDAVEEETPRQLAVADRFYREPAPVATTMDPMLAVIERAARDASVDVDKLERMLAMKERLDDHARADRDAEAKRVFFVALAAAQRAVPVVVRTRTNKFGGYNYADLADIETQAMPVIRQHGFSVTAWSAAGAEPGMQRVYLRVAHEAGHCHEFYDDFPLDAGGKDGKSNKTAIQAKGSTTSYGRRYLTCGYFGIATADDDGDGGRHNPQPGTTAAATELTASQAKTLRDLIAATGTDERKFLGVAKAASVEEIRPADYPRLESLLKRKQAEAARAEPEAPAIAAE